MSQDTQSISERDCVLPFLCATQVRTCVKAKSSGCPFSTSQHRSEHRSALSTLPSSSETDEATEAVRLTYQTQQGGGRTIIESVYRCTYWRAKTHRIDRTYSTSGVDIYTLYIYRRRTSFGSGRRDSHCRSCPSTSTSAPCCNTPKGRGVSVGPCNGSAKSSASARKTRNSCGHFMKVNAETSPPEQTPPPAAVASVEVDCGDCGELLEVGLWLRGLVVWKLLLGLSEDALSSEHWDTFASTCVSNTNCQDVSNTKYQHVSNIKKTNSTGQSDITSQNPTPNQHCCQSYLMQCQCVGQDIAGSLSQHLGDVIEALLELRGGGGGEVDLSHGGRHREAPAPVIVAATRHTNTSANIIELVWIYMYV